MFAYKEKIYLWGLSKKQVQGQIPYYAKVVRYIRVLLSIKLNYPRLAARKRFIKKEESGPETKNRIIAVKIGKSNAAYGKV